jgi:hypothetical protein
MFTKGDGPTEQIWFVLLLPDGSASVFRRPFVRGGEISSPPFFSGTFILAPLGLPP